MTTDVTQLDRTPPEPGHDSYWDREFYMKRDPYLFSALDRARMAEQEARFQKWIDAGRLPTETGARRK